jgi:ketosteroid isomerase-like protein
MLKESIMLSRSVARLALVFLLGCSQRPDSPADPQAVEAAVRQFFDHIATFDYDGIRDVVTPDLELMEDTLRLDREGFVEFIRQFEGATVSFELSEFNTEFADQIAYTSYRNRAVMTIAGETVPMEWLESIVFRWVDGAWKIDRLQTTPIHDQRT